MMRQDNSRLPIWALGSFILLAAAAVIFLFDHDPPVVTADHERTAQIDIEDIRSENKTHNGETISEAPEATPPTPTREDLPLEVAGEASRIEISIRDSRATPVTDVDVFLVSIQGATLPEKSTTRPEALLDSLAVARAKSDETGTVRLATPRDVPYVVVARRRGFGATAHWVESLQQDRVEIEMTRTQPFRARVIDGATGEPVAEAQAISVRHPRATALEDDIRIELDRVLVGQSATTDSEGRLSFDQLKDEYHFLFVKAEGYPPAELHAVAPGNAEVLVRLRGSRKFRGIVTDEDGEPIAGAKVNASVRGELPITNVKTQSASDGTFSFESVPHGPLGLWVVANGYGFVKKFYGPEGVDDFVEFELTPQAEFSGVVVDDLGQIVVGALVDISSLNAAGQVGTMLTEEDGSWYMYWVQEGDTIVIGCTKDGYAPLSIPSTVAPQSEIRLTLEREGSIVGRVVDESGRPIRAFSHYNLMETLPRSTEDASLLIDRWKRVDSHDGTFEIDKRWPGTHLLMVEAPGYQQTVVRGIEVPAGGPSDVVEIVLPTSAGISGTVLDESGRPLNGVSVYLPNRTSRGSVHCAFPCRRSVTDTSGRFSLATVPDHPFTLAAESTKFGTTLLENCIPVDFPRTVVLATPGSLVGILVTDWPGPDSILKVRAIPVGTDAVFEAQPDRFAAFQFPALAPGRYFVEVEDFWRSQEIAANVRIGKWVDILPGQTTTIQLSASAKGSIRGHVGVPSDVVDWHSLQVNLMRAGGASDTDGTRGELVSYATLQNEGQYELFGVEPGRYVVQLASRMSGVAIDVQQETVVGDGVASVVVDLEMPSSLVSGIVLDEDLKPVDALVQLVNRDSQRVSSTTRTSPEGRYQIFSSDRGSFWVRVFAAGFAESLDEELHLPDDSPASLEHWLEPEARLWVETVDDRGTPLAGAHLQLKIRELPLPAGLREQKSRLDGKLFSRLPAGLSFLTASLEGYVPAGPEEIHLASGESRTVTLKLARLGHLSVLVKQAEGAPAASQLLTLTAQDVGPAESNAVQRRTDAAGSAQFRDLPPGTYTLTGEGFDPVPATIAPGETTTLEVQMLAESE